MIVTDITDEDKKRVRIHTDSEEDIVLYRGELERYGIVCGGELPLPVYEEIVSDLLSKRAKLRAMKLLEHHDYTEKLLRDKLTDGGYPESVVTGAIDYVKSYGYIDDERYARNYCESRSQRKSRAVVKAELTARGIDRDILERVIEEAFSGDGEPAELLQIRSYLDKKHYDAQSWEFKDKQKIMAALMRRGYPMDLIRQAMQQ